MSKISHEWMIAASDDLATIESIADKPSLTHIVAFHAQQCVEKSLKGVIEEFELQSAKIHNLRRLFSVCDRYVTLDEKG